MFLDEIVRTVDERVRDVKPRAAEWLRLAEGMDPPRSLKAALSGDSIGVIAECKHRSPSKGWLTDHYDPVEQAIGYEREGASAISVLTEPHYFAGDLEHLTRVRERVGRPVLRKDFLRDPVQVMEARAAGADAVLLIVRIIDDSARLADLWQTARGLGMDVLVEIHQAGELDRALALNPDIVGVNNRDLDTFETTLDFSRQMAAEIPPGIVKVSESGLNTLADVQQIQQWGYEAILVGESLMRGARLLEEIRAWR